MKKILILVAIISLVSCKTNKEKCIDGLTKKGYSYEEACDECEQLKEDSEARYEGE
jgi:SOS response regulatory protein OraA/RecX